MCQLPQILVLKAKQKIITKLHAYLQAFLPFKFSTDWVREGMMAALMMIMMMIIIIIITNKCKPTKLLPTINRIL